MRWPRSVRRRGDAPKEPTAQALTLAVIGLTLLLAFTESLLLSGRHPTTRLDLGAPEAGLLLSGFHAPEEDGSRQFRWTAGRSELRFLNTGVGGAPLLGVRLGPGLPDRPAPDLTIALDGRPFTTLDIDERPRSYMLLIPDSALADGTLTVQLESRTVTIPPDTRAVGLRVEAVSLDALAARAVLPALGVALAPGLLLGCLAFALRRLHTPTAPALAGLLAAALGLGLAQVAIGAPLLPIYLARLAGAGLALAAITALALPALERHAPWFTQAAHAPGTRSSPGPLGSDVIRALWAAALLACAVRLVGTLYPPFDAYDLSLNLGRFLRTAAGDMVDTNRSFEFRSGVTIYPAGPYLALMPGVLLGLTPKLAVQGGIALLDGLGAFATGALALRLGTGARTAIFAATLYAALPVMLTSLWFGHTAQVFGQGLMAPLALALVAGAGGERRGWLVAGALLSMALLSHIGVTILAAAWLGLALPALYPALGRRAWGHFTLMLIVSAVAGLALVYGPEAQLKLVELAKVGERVAEPGGGPAYNLIWRAFQISFYEAGWMLGGVGLFLLGRRWRRMPRGAAALLGAWLAAATLFWGVEMLTALQVRYLVFVAPVVCILVGALLARLAGRGEVGSVAAWTTTALLLAIGCVPWYIGVFQNVQMSMVPLLR